MYALAKTGTRYLSGMSILCRKGRAMQFFEYKGYTIYPLPRLLGVTGCWMINLIIKHGKVIKNFSKQDFFPTQGEAVFHSLHYGKQLIDRGQCC